ncbi:Winged helix-turn-helix DNA-binding protein [uncultured archaeon]|nr:Winged helix-turn-helix DNA-binding protein [uncultured archaeon]
MLRLPKDEVLELDVRRKIYEEIVKSPGLHVRELQRRVNIAYGALQYHLSFLVKHNLVAEEKGVEYSRFFPTEFKSIRERELMSLLRQESIRRILLHLLNTPAARNKELAEGVGLSPSTVSWHISKLTEVGAVVQENKGGDVLFRVSEPEVVTRLLVTYKSSFLDTIVDRFVEVWEKENIKTAK